MMNAVEVSGIVKSFGAVRAVDGVSFSVAPGESVVLLGPNGSGKSTTIKCAAGLLGADSGDVRIMGANPRRDKKRALSNLAFLPQTAAFPANLTAVEIVEFHALLRGRDKSAAAAALAEAGIANEAATRPCGTYSGGMRQRLSLAVASVSGAPVMLLDEPTANLDPEAAIAFRRVARNWRDAGKALLISTHVLSDVEQLADRVVILVGGKAVASVTIGDLRTKLQHFARLRVDVGKPSDLHVAAALECGATQAKLNSHAVLITAPVERRLAILERLSSLGIVNRFETEEPSLEDVYIDYVRGANNG